MKATCTIATLASLATSLLLASNAGADANVCASGGTLVAGISLAHTAEVTATYCGTDAGDTNELSLDQPEFQFIATGHVTANGHVVDLGVFTGGTGLIFAIHDRNSGWTFYSAQTLNPDNVAHAAIHDLGNGDYHIGFEDQFGGGDHDFNDIEMGVHLRFDSDGDGLFDDEDACPGTEAGGVIDDDGCSIADLCPCSGGWKNHGAYVSCVAHASNDFVADGLLTGAEKGAVQSAAGKSSCGK